MTTRMLLTLALFCTLLGASFSFADGMIGDADAIRARGGVGNYLFHQDYREPGKTDAILSKKEARREGFVSAEEFENEPSYTATETEVDTLGLSASSAVAPAGNPESFGAILFPSGGAKVPANESERLDSIASYLKADPALSAQVVGYTDAAGEASRNDELSKARAENVVQALKRRGVSESQLSWVGRGEADPASENTSNGGRALNRRVEVQFE